MSFTIKLPITLTVGDFTDEEQKSLVKVLCEIVHSGYGVDYEEETVERDTVLLRLLITEGFESLVQQAFLFQIIDEDLAGDIEDLFNPTDVKVSVEV